MFGLLTGVLGAGYNRLVLLFLDHVASVHRDSQCCQGGLIGAIIGLVMYIYPRAVGGGRELTEAILIGEKFLLSVIVGYLLLRFVAGPLSYPPRWWADCSRRCPSAHCGDLLHRGGVSGGPGTSGSSRFRWP